MAKLTRTYCEEVYHTIRSEDRDAQVYLMYRKGMDELKETVLDTYVAVVNPNDIKGYAKDRGLKYYNILNDEGRYTIQNLTIKKDAMILLHQNLNAQLRLAVDIIEKRHNMRSNWKGDINKYNFDGHIAYRQGQAAASKKSLFAFR